MENSWSYLKDSGDFLKKMKSISSIPEDNTLVTANIVGLYPSIPHTAGLAALRDALDNREVKKIPTEDLVKIEEFVLKNNYFEFNRSINNNFPEQRQGQSLPIHMLVSLWINLKLTSLKLKHYNLQCGLDISMMLSIYGLTEKKILNGF